MFFEFNKSLKEISNSPVAIFFFSILRSSINKGLEFTICLNLTIPPNSSLIANLGRLNLFSPMCSGLECCEKAIS